MPALYPDVLRVMRIPALLLVTLLSGCAGTVRLAPPAAVEPAPVITKPVAVVAAPASAAVNSAARDLRDGNVDLARTRLDERISAAPDDCHALVQRGLLERQQLGFRAAEADYQACLAVTPGFLPAILNLGILYELYLGEPEKALAQYRTYQALAPESRVASWIAVLERRVDERANLLAGARQ